MTNLTTEYMKKLNLITNTSKNLMNKVTNDYSIKFCKWIKLVPVVATMLSYKRLEIEIIIRTQRHLNTWMLTSWKSAIWKKFIKQLNSLV